MDKSLQESDYLIAWLAFLAASTVLGGIVGGLFGAVAGSVLAAANVDTVLIVGVVRVWAWLLAIPVSYGCFRMVAGSMVAKKALARAHCESSSTTAAPLDSALFGEPVGGRDSLGTGEEAAPLRPSGLGALSLGCAAAAATLYVALIAYVVATDFGETQILYAGVGLVIASGLGFFALGIGVGSLFQSGRKRLVPVIGLVSSSLFVAVLALTWTVIGIAVLAFA